MVRFDLLRPTLLISERNKDLRVGDPNAGSSLGNDSCDVDVADRRGRTYCHLEGSCRSDKNLSLRSIDPMSAHRQWSRRRQTYGPGDGQCANRQHADHCCRAGWPSDPHPKRYASQFRCEAGRGETSKNNSAMSFKVKGDAVDLITRWRCFSPPDYLPLRKNLSVGSLLSLFSFLFARMRCPSARADIAK